MNTQTHTPGPWILEQDTVFIGETRKVQPVLYHGDSEGMANARLIAAAPDLLAVLSAIVSDYHALQRSQGATASLGAEFTAGEWLGSRLGGHIAQAELAIAKATP